MPLLDAPRTSRPEPLRNIDETRSVALFFRFGARLLKMPVAFLPAAPLARLCCASFSSPEYWASSQSSWPKSTYAPVPSSSSMKLSSRRFFTSSW